MVSVGGTKGLLWPRYIGLSQWVRNLVLYLVSVGIPNTLNLYDAGNK
jgi:hypothetical protein